MVVVGTAGNRDKAVSGIERRRGRIVFRYFEGQRRRAAPPRRRRDRGEERRADAAPALIGNDAERQDFAGVAEVEDEGKTDRRRLLPGDKAETTGHAEDLAAGRRVPRIVG